MQYRQLGRTGLKVSELCLGTMQFGWSADEPLSWQILTAAFEAGINFIDTADIYSRWVPGNPGGVAETIVGTWMREHGIHRDQLIIATKVRGRSGDNPNDEGLSRSHIFHAVEGSLKRLGTDYIDLYQAHWYDENVPIDETLTAFDDLVHQGKVRYIGCSNYPAWRLTESLRVAEMRNISRYESLQPHYNLVHRDEFERELADVCRRYQLGVIPYSPLAAGFLTGKYTRVQAVDSVRARSVQRYFNEKNWKLLETMESIGQQYGGHSLSQIAIAWLRANPLITSPIIGPRSLEQLEDNVGGAMFDLTEHDQQALDQASSWIES